MKEMNSQSGVSLVTILVGLGLMGIMLKVIGSSVQSISSVRSFAAKSQASLGVEGALINSLAKSIRKGVVDAGCGAGLTSVIGDQKLSSDDTSSVGFRYTDKIATKAWPAEVPTEHTAAKQSCTKPYVDQQGKFYFCIDFNLSNPSARDSFFDSTYAFAEAAVVLTDIHTNKKVSCDYFAKNPTTTVSKIYYSLYYSKPIAGKNKFFKKNGMLFGID